MGFQALAGDMLQPSQLFLLTVTMWQRPQKHRDGVEQDLATVALGTEPASSRCCLLFSQEVTQPLVTSAFTVRVVSDFVSAAVVGNWFT